MNVRATVGMTLVGLLIGACAPTPSTSTGRQPASVEDTSGADRAASSETGNEETDVTDGETAPAAQADGAVTAIDYEAPEQYRVGDDRPIGLKATTRSWETDWAVHSVPYSELGSGGVPRDGIPPIDAPRTVSIEAADDWLADVEPVIAVTIDDEARAYPLQILTYHEVANDRLGGVPIAVTFCPLCNAALAFDRRAAGTVLDFGVSGLLRNSDLVMWDRQTESLWQQLEGRAIAGELTGLQLEIVPSFLISWADFKANYPDGDVLSRDTGFERPYGQNPYPGYDEIGESPFLFKGRVDDRLEAMERVVAVEHGDETVAYPYRELSEGRVVNDTVAGTPIVVLWQPGTTSALDAGNIASGRDVGAAAAFARQVDGQTLTFAPSGEEAFTDEETGSTWTLVGRATEGPLAGTQLEPVTHANHFWFAWAAFKPETQVWGPDEG